MVVTEGGQRQSIVVAGNVQGWSWSMLVSGGLCYCSRMMVASGCLRLVEAGDCQWLSLVVIGASQWLSVVVTGGGQRWWWSVVADGGCR